ncbi:hypothetical protein ACQUZK_09055, partial [Streptococcus pyogenes]|uniref:hypothetical protein n=1 Tax=Streptococcus pyogenes TaxID=1314 RepID=UPI003DA1223D
MAVFSVHFDGPIAVDHRVSVRVLARTYEHMQRAIDRAYLINLYGDVYKHARLTAKQYKETEFIAEYPREGGIILDAVKQGAGPIVDRIFSAVRPVFEAALGEGLQQHAALTAQFEERRTYVTRMGVNTPTYEQVASEPPPNWASNYSNRSVMKEIDQLVAQVAPQELAGSSVDVTLIGDVPHLPLHFDSRTATRFHQIASHRELGPPMIIHAVIRALDRGNRFTRPNAKILNLATGREVTLLCTRAGDADALHPFHNNEPVHLFVSPMIEAMGFDMKGGD